MNPINIVVGLVIILALVLAGRRVFSKKDGCGCGCDSCHSACPSHEIEK